MPKEFETSWIFFTGSDGVYSEEVKMRAEMNVVQVHERVLMKQIKTLKELESIPKRK